LLDLGNADIAFALIVINGYGEDGGKAVDFILALTEPVKKIALLAAFCTATFTRGLQGQRIPWQDRL